MDAELSRSIYRTLCYADVFEFPLTAREVWRYLISPRQRSRAEVEAVLVNLVESPEPWLRREDNFFCLIGGDDLAGARRLKAREAVRKEKIVQKYLPALTFLPSVLLVAVTGSLALGVAGEDEDIDVLVVAGEGTVWVTRLLLTATLDLLGRRRKPNGGSMKDKICLNMFLDETSLSVPEKERDLYTAHEVLQMKPLFDRGNIYRRFLEANYWVGACMANGYNEKMRSSGSRRGKGEGGWRSRHRWLEALFRLLEPLARALQLRYMRPRVTKEILTDSIIRFHPQDARDWILPEYKNRLLTRGEVFVINSTC
jgi:D-beta-D-heptose 7-phosphate kinase/D-beta-D-heptose 1-phosphate adenosyltransferase